MSKDTIAKAILNASEEKPTEFRRNIETAVAEKMKEKLAAAVKAAETKVFQSIK